VKLSQLFNFKQNTNQRIKARYDAAQTNSDNVRHWSAADGLSADMATAFEVRKTLRERSRYEVANNSYAKGLVQMLANDTIGTGPRLQMLTANEEVNSRAERDFQQWAEHIRLSGKLRTMRMTRCQDGEVFAIISTNPKVKSGVKIDLMLIEADRVTDNTYNLRDLSRENIIDGIKYDDYGNPVSYRVLRYHPGDYTVFKPDDVIVVPAEYMIHVFQQDRPGQHRGVPEITAALPLFAQLRRYNSAVLSAAEAAASFAAVLYTDAPPDGETEALEPLDTVPLQRNTMVTLPGGWKLGQLDPKQPTANHSEFVKIILSEISRCVCATYGSVAGDYSGFNYASGRLDNQLYHKAVLVDRSNWESEVLNPLFDVWFKEYRLANSQLFNSADFDDFSESHTWFWDGFLHVDPYKEANAQEKRLNNNTTTLAAECAKDGRDYMTTLKQRARELKIMGELGIPLSGSDSSAAPDNKSNKQTEEDMEDGE